MKTKVLLLLALLVALSSCKKDSPLKEALITELELTVSKTRVLDDSTDEIIASVSDQDGNNVTSEVVLVFNDLVLLSNSITSGTSGTFNLYAEHKDIKSNNVQIEVVEDSGFEYEKIVLMEQFTATSCPWCPRAISQIEDLRVLDDKVTHIAYHLNDEFSYSYNRSLFEEFGLSGIPAVMADRVLNWDGNASDINTMHKPVRAGIDLEVSEIAADAFTIEVSVRFGKLFTESINLGLYLIEDNLVANQKSNYNNDSNSPWYQMGETIPDLEHKNVMLKTVTNLFGDPVPFDSIDIGSLYSKTYSVNATGTGLITDPAQAKIVAFLSYASGEKSGELINSLVCNIGTGSENEVVGSK